MGRRKYSGLSILFLAFALVACGDDPLVIEPPSELVAPFVGTWDAEVFMVTSDADPSTVANLVLEGSFVINIQPSGRYTATLAFGDVIDPIIEIGSLRPSENGTVTLQPNGGDPATSTFEFIRPDYLRLDGPTEFDFNRDATVEPAQAHIELQRRAS